MAKGIKIRISGKAIGTDAPTADDLLGQVGDFLAILRGVELAIAEDGQSAIDWRVVNASKNSPLEVELGAFPRQYAVNVDRRAQAVALRAAEGLSMLRDHAERPPFFTDPILTRAARTFERVTNGLDLSEIDFGDGLPVVAVTPAIGRQAGINARIALEPREKPYREIGVVEGITEGAEVDGFGRRILFIKHRISGATIKCILNGEALEIVQDHRIADVFRRRRARVFGVVNYRGIGRIGDIDATRVEFARPTAELPTVDDILDVDFTGGLPSEEYLNRLRDGRLT